MDNINTYLAGMTEFRNNLRAIGAKYQPEYDPLDRYKDSASYTEDRKRIDQRRKADEEEIRSRYTQTMYSSISAMRAAYAKKPITTVAPTQDQLNILAALKMLENPSHEELTKAAKTMTGCPLAERVVADIARTKNIIVPITPDESGADMEKFFDSLAKNGGTFIRDLDTYTARGDYMALTLGPNKRPDLFRMDAEDLCGAEIGRFGNFDCTYETLCSLVND